MDIGASNATLMLSISGLAGFQTPVALEGFAADDVYDLDEVESVETLMGVDGKLSGGFVWVKQPQTIMLQADSLSNEIFDQWNNNQQSNETTYTASMTLILPEIGLKMIHTVGFLTRYKLPGAKKLIQPRRYGITWQRVVPQPA